MPLVSATDWFQTGQGRSGAHVLWRSVYFQWSRFTFSVAEHIFFFILVVFCYSDKWFEVSFDQVEMAEMAQGSVLSILYSFTVLSDERIFQEASYARIRLHKCSSILIRFWFSWQISMVRPEYKCLDWQSGLVVWRSRNSDVASGTPHRKVLHFRIWGIFWPSLTTWSYNVILDVPLIATMGNFLTRRHARMWRMIGRGQTCSVAGLKTKISHNLIPAPLTFCKPFLQWSSWLCCYFNNNVLVVIRFNKTQQIVLWQENNSWWSCAVMQLPHQNGWFSFLTACPEVFNSSYIIAIW